MEASEESSTTGVIYMKTIKVNEDVTQHVPSTIRPEKLVTWADDQPIPITPTPACFEPIEPTPKNGDHARGDSTETIYICLEETDY